MEKKDITRLVVGEPFVLTLGTTSATTPKADNPVKGGEWRGGRQLLKPNRIRHLLSGVQMKKPATVIAITAQTAAQSPHIEKPEATISSASNSEASDVQQPEYPNAPLTESVNLQLPLAQRSREFKVAAIGAVFAIAAVAATAYIWFMPEPNLATQANNDDIAVVPDAGSSVLAAKEATVRTLDEPWIREAPAPALGQMDDASTAPSVPIIPVLPPDASLASASTMPKTQAQTPSPTSSPGPTAGIKKPVDAKVDARPDKKSVAAAEAVVLDTEPASSASKSNDANPAAATSQTSETRDPSKRAPRSGLVAITPDGKAALFTNPATRLPEKFVVGEKTRAGEVIQSIDAKNGVVRTETKEYRLE